ncbi:MAG: transglutaminaseTgpA domain-containing protein [Acidimicrobiales bacterium]
MSAMDSIRKVNAKATPEESIPFRVAVLIAVLAAIHAVVGQGIGGIGLQIGATAGVAGGFAYSHWARFRPGFVLKAFLAIGVVVAFAGFLMRVFSASEVLAVQVPLAELFLWVQVLHSMDVPARRDLLFSLVSSLVLIGVAGVLSRSTGLGINLAVWAVAALVSLALAYRSELRDLPALSVRDGAPSPPPIKASGIGPIVAAATLVLALGLLVMLVVPQAGPGRAVTFPASLRSRLAVPQAGGLSNSSLGQSDPGRPGEDQGGRASFGYFGFSTELDTSIRGRPDNTLVMRVKASRPDFWRGQTFDSWDGRTWRQTDDKPEVNRSESPISLRGAPEDVAQQIRERGEPFVQTFYIERAGPNVIFAANVADQLYIADRAVFEMSDGTIRTGVELNEGAVYTVSSRRLRVDEPMLRSSDAVLLPDSPDWQSLRARYLQLPEPLPARVAALARDVTQGEPSTYDKVRALERWMAVNTTYTLDIPPLPRGADAVEQYLFEDRQGFCEQIASSLVVMLRSLGIPARLAVGYTPGERNPFTGLYEVRASDAHSWAEVLFPGVGWQAFDPTAEVPLAGDYVSDRAGSGLATWLGGRLPSRSTMILIATAIGGLLLAGLIGDRTRRVVVGRSERRARPWRVVAMDRLEELGAEAGRERRPTEAPARYARALRFSVLPDPRLEALGSAIEADGFGPRPLGDEERGKVDALLEELEQRVAAGEARSSF